VQQHPQGVISRACKRVESERNERAQEQPGVGHFRLFCYGSVTYVQFLPAFPGVMEVATFAVQHSSYGYRSERSR
jgi:hypothetical protein